MTTLPHVRLNVSGTLGPAGGNEIWSVGIKIGITAAGAPTVLIAPNQADVNDISVGAVGFWTSLITAQAANTDVQSYFSDNVAITQIKAAAVLATGLDDGNIATSITDVVAGNRGKASAASTVVQCGQVPYTVALVVTQRGATYLRGPAAYGRFYLPCPNLWLATVTATPRAMSGGCIHPSTLDSLLSQARGTITAHNSLTLSSTHVPKVALISKTTGAVAARWQPVSRVTMDNRPDTVRRRSNKIGGLGVQSINL